MSNIGDVQADIDLDVSRYVQRARTLMERHQGVAPCEIVTTEEVEMVREVAALTFALAGTFAHTLPVAVWEMLCQVSAGCQMVLREINDPDRNWSSDELES